MSKKTKTAGVRFQAMMLRMIQKEIRRRKINPWVIWREAACVIDQEIRGRTGGYGGYNQLVR